MGILLEEDYNLRAGPALGEFFFVFVFNMILLFGKLFIHVYALV